MQNEKSGTNAKRCFIISTALLVAFFVLILLLYTVDRGAYVITGSAGRFEIEIGLKAINVAVADSVPYNSFWYDLSEILGVLCLLLAGGFAVFGIIQLVTRKSLKKVDKKIYLLAAFYVLIAVLYAFFEIVIINYRPALLTGEKEASFPSSHTVLSLCVCLSSVTVLGYYVKNKKVLCAANIALAALGALTVFARALSGVHWLTDIIGGVLLSFALWFAFKASVNLLDSRNLQ